MGASTERDPAWVSAILGWRGTVLAARIALTSAYLQGALAKLLDFPGTVAEQEHFGLHPGVVWAALCILVELGGSALVITGRLVWLGAGALGVLTAVATCVAEDFWAKAGHERAMALNGFFEHLGLIASFILVAAIAASERRRRDF